MDTFLHDLRSGLRMLSRTPGFTLAAVITLALGIAANTAIFSVVNGVLLKSLPFPESDRLVAISGSSRDGPVTAVSYPDYLDLRARQTTFENLAARMPAGGVLTGEGEPQRVIGRYVTASFFATLGVRPHIGRFFEEEEDKPGADPVMVLSYGLWRSYFGGDPNRIGKSVRFNGESWTVIGVMPAGLDFYGQTNLNNDFFIPLGRLTTQEYMHDRHSHSHFLFVTGRMKLGVAIEKARSEMKAIAAQLQEQYPESNTGNSVELTPLLDDYVGDSRPALLVISAAVVLVLLIACANVANLLLARAVSRQKEIAVRMALGAGRWRVVRQLVTEAVLLAAVGGMLGLLMAAWGVELLLKLNPDGLPRSEDIAVDPRVLGFTLLVTMLTGLAFGLAPALQTSKVDLSDALKGGGRQASSSASAARLRGGLVIGEIALSLVLLVAAGLLLKSFRQLMLVDPGFDPNNVLTLRLRLPDAEYREPEKPVEFLKEVTRRVSNLPGVLHVSVATGFPLGRGGDNSYWIEGQPEPQESEDWPSAVSQSVSESYHRALGIGLLAGRYFTELDRADSPPVVIVDEAFVRKHFPDGSIEGVLGKRLRFGGKGEPWREIVGVVRHVRQAGLEEEGRPGICRPWLQINPKWLADLTRAMDLIVKTGGEPESFVAGIKREVQTVDPDEPLGNVRTLESLLSESTAPRRFSLWLVSVFAGVALVLGAIGLYGVMSFVVAQRTREIGIRVALGAQSIDVLRLVIRQGMLLSLIGVLVGLAASLVLTRLMSSLLFGVSAVDPVIFSAVSVVLTGVALAACFVPARRATRVDAMVALRYE
ncbi:MAG TPA: ABC transporter permease [Blastocatellia bacterium]|nr:ABC transporter permease [Blastocatellia bacterium]